MARKTELGQKLDTIRKRIRASGTRLLTLDEIERSDVDEYMIGKEAAEKLGYEYTNFTRMLKAGRVPGAKKQYGMWWVPTNVTREDVERPVGRPSGSGS